MTTQKQRRFTKTQVCAIRHSINVLNESASSVAKRYSAASSTVNRIAMGGSYADIPMARPIPGFPSYLAYPNGKVWSTTRSKFLKSVNKGSGTYYNLWNGNDRQAIPRKGFEQRMFS